MIFASTSLAARIERAECQLVIDGTRSAEKRRANMDVFLRKIAGGVASFALDGSPLNKLAGLGFEGPVDVSELEEIEAVFADRGSPLQVELSILADPSIGALLTERGYVLQGFENVLGRTLPGEAPTQRAEGVAIAPSGDADLPVWMDTVVTGFCSPDSQGVPSHESFPRDILEEAIGDMAASEGFRRFLARRDGDVAGGASMRLCEGVAQLCGAATLPAHRRRGVQSALLAQRLAVASAEGCDVAVVTTQPGSKSHQNVQRQGFELLYTRAILVRGG